MVCQSQVNILNSDLAVCSLHFFSFIPVIPCIIRGVSLFPRPVFPLLLVLSLSLSWWNLIAQRKKIFSVIVFGASDFLFIFSHEINTHLVVTVHHIICTNLHLIIYKCVYYSSSTIIKLCYEGINKYLGEITQKILEMCRKAVTSQWHVQQTDVTNLQQHLTRCIFLRQSYFAESRRKTPERIRLNSTSSYEDKGLKSSHEATLPNPAWVFPPR